MSPVIPLAQRYLVCIHVKCIQMIQTVCHLTLTNLASISFDSVHRMFLEVYEEVSYSRVTEMNADLAIW